MSNKVLLDAGAETGVEETAHFDADGNLSAVQRQADIEPLLDENKRVYNLGLVNRSSEFRKVASFDPITIEIFCKRWGVESAALFRRENKELVKRLLNDPDLRHFRTLPGRV